MNRKRIRDENSQKDSDCLRIQKFAIVNLPYSKWLATIKLFEFSISARKVIESKY
jgi:hypothetical protein